MLCYWRAAPITDTPDFSADEQAGLDATMQSIAATHGYVSNLMQTLALAPEGLAGFAALSGYTTYGSHLTEYQRQLTILVAVRDVHYCWTHHAPLARAAGVSEDHLLLIQEGRIPKDLPEAEHALCDYAFEITAGRRIPPRVADGMHAHFAPRQIVDIALLTAHSMSVAALALGLEVPIEPPETLQFELQWQQHKSTETD